MVIINMHCCEQHLSPEIYTVIPVTIQINAAKLPVSQLTGNFAKRC